MTQTTDLEQRLRALVERQRDQRGDMMTLGEADPEIIEAADELTRLREALEGIATLSAQREEPWPDGSEMDRLHFWRDRVIDAAEIARTALKGSRHE